MTERAQEIKRLFAAYPRPASDPYTPDMVRVYTGDLATIPDASLPVVLREARMQSDRYLPSIGQIMRIWRAMNPEYDRIAPAWEFLGITKRQFYDHPGREYERDIIFGERERRP